MKTINKPGGNLGGLLKIYAVPCKKFSISGTNVSFTDTSEIYKIYCTPETMEFNEEMEETQAGVLFNTSISGFSPAVRDELKEAIKDMTAKNYVIIFQEGNGLYWLAGTRSQPLRLTANLTTGQNVSDRAGYHFLFTGQTNLPVKLILNPFR